MDDVKFLVSGGTIAPLSGLEGRCPKVLSAILTSYASHAHRDRTSAWLIEPAPAMTTRGAV